MIYNISRYTHVKVHVTLITRCSLRLRGVINQVKLTKVLLHGEGVCCQCLLWKGCAVNDKQGKGAL